jgi:MoaA/NifB/PqqE/SkfB family radical SAM enzyme
MSKLKEKTMCLAPWMSIHTWPDGKTFPCCLWNSNEPIGDLNTQPLKEIWNSEELKKTRLGMISGEKINACTRCYEIEASGANSYRERINRIHGKYEHYINDTNEDGSLDSMNLHLWDLRISNFCNLKCRSCGAELSSSWYEDAKKLEKIPEGRKALISITDKSKFLNDIEEHYKCVDEIYFAGGEPLLMPEHYTILDRLIDLGRDDVHIRYSTNFSKLKFGKKSIIDYWKKFSNLEVYISVDGVGKTGEFVRKGYNDEIFANNVRTLLESEVKMTHFGYTVTFGVLNFLHLFDIVIDFCKRDLLEYKTFDHNSPVLIFNGVTTPDYYDCKYLPQSYKEEFSKRLLTFDKELEEIKACTPFIKYILERLKPVENHCYSGEFNSEIMQECVKITNKLDNLRDENFVDIYGYKVEDLLINN